jgi:hypothetical protein
MDTQGSIRGSLKGKKSLFQAQTVKPVVLETAKQFLENFSLDSRIRQPLYPEKMEQSIGKHTYYVLGHEQKYEPGFLLFMKGHPLIFIDSRFRKAVSLRLRLSASMYQSNSVFIATLDSLFGTLQLEDVWILEDKSCVHESYSSRIKRLERFYANSFVQDKRLSGLTVTLPELFPLSSLRTLVDSRNYSSIDFIPEQGGRRRLFLSLIQKPKEHISTNEPETPIQTQLETPTQPDPKAATIAFAAKCKGLPDVYDLQDERGNSLGKAAVQTTEMSTQLRQQFSASVQTVKVQIQWYEEFSKYKIVGLF